MSCIAASAGGGSPVRCVGEPETSRKALCLYLADGVYFYIRSDDVRQCVLGIISVAGHRKKAFLAIEGGYREPEQSWSRC